MYINPTRFSGRPEERRTEPEEAIYDVLAEMEIPYDRVDHDYADTMEDCLQIERLLEGKICKNLFLCNRQQTEFYLLLMPSGKPFKTKYLSGQLGCSRLSFAGENHMEELLHTIPGSVSALELIFDRERKVRLLIDRDLLADDVICAHPGRSTSTLKISQQGFMRYVIASGHNPTFIDLPEQPE